MTSKVLEVIVKERPAGTAANNEILDFLEMQLKAMNYDISSLPFDCVVWEKGKSNLLIDNRSFAVEPSPFSEPFKGSGKLRFAKTLEELEDISCSNDILVLSGEITASPLQPKNYPFYYPDEHKRLISLLEEKQPKAIIAVTGKNPLNGQNPFPFFEDGNFLIPSCNINEKTLSQIKFAVPSDEVVQLIIDSKKIPSASRQIVASKKIKESAVKIVLCAHMDTKYDTPGALDNAAGVAVLLRVAELLKDTAYNIDIVPFNSEEFYGACGELEYLKQIDNEKAEIGLLINIDSPCHKGAQTAISIYNPHDGINQITSNIMNRSQGIINGQEWYAGDHVPFVFRGIPCLAVTSSDLFSGALEHTHTPNDTIHTVDFDMVDCTAEYLAEVVIALY